MEALNNLSFLSALSFHHIGMACFDIDKTSAYYETIGYAKTEIVVDPLQNVKVCVLQKEGSPTIELLAPVDDKSPVCGILKKSGVSPYHICYQTSDMNATILELRNKRFTPPLGFPKMSNVFLHKVCFLYHKDVGLIELIEIEQ